MRTIRPFLLLVALVAGGGLALPAAAQGGVTLFEHESFGGVSESFSADVARLGGTRIGNDRASSVRVAPGCTATLYQDEDFRGPATVLRADARRLTATEAGNDSVSSLRVFCAGGGAHGIVLYTDSEYRGRESVFYEDTSSLLEDRFPDDAASSVRVPAGCSVTLYEHPDYRGRSETLYEDDPLLANNRIGNDAVSSLRVRCRGTGVGRGAPPPVGGLGLYRCVDRDTAVAFRIDETGRGRGTASLLLGDVTVASFQARRVGDTYELRPTGRADGTVTIDLGREEIAVGDRGARRVLCRWR